MTSARTASPPAVGGLERHHRHGSGRPLSPSPRWSASCWSGWRTRRWLRRTEGERTDVTLEHGGSAMAVGDYLESVVGTDDEGGQPRGVGEGRRLECARHGREGRWFGAPAACGGEDFSGTPEPWNRHGQLGLPGARVGGDGQRLREALHAEGHPDPDARVQPGAERRNFQRLSQGAPRRTAASSATEPVGDGRRDDPGPRRVGLLQTQGNPAGGSQREGRGTHWPAHVWATLLWSEHREFARWPAPG